MKSKKLIVLTSQFPYGNGETFLETEILFLANGFDEVLIYSSANSADRKRDLPENVKSVLFPSRLSKLDKLKALTGIFSKEFRSEKKRVLEVYKQEWSKGIRNTALISLFIGKRWKHEMEKEMRRSRGVDLTFYSYWCTDTAVGLALLSQSNPSVKTLSRVHGWDLYFEATAFNYQPYRSLIQKNSTAICPISDKGKATIKHVWKVPDTNVVTSRLGVDRQKVQSRRHRGVFTIVSCSNVIPLKRVRLIAESVLLLKEPIKWVHFGDGEAFDDISKFVTKTKQSHHEIVFVGHVDNEVVLDFYRENRVDLFINTSTTEGIPFSIMEAISFGIPILATDVGGNSEIVGKENGCLLSANPSAMEIVTEIERFLKMPQDHYHRFSNASYEKWENMYNAEKNFTEFVQLLLK